MEGMESRRARPGRDASTAVELCMSEALSSLSTTELRITAKLEMLQCGRTERTRSGFPRRGARAAWRRSAVREFSFLTLGSGRESGIPEGNRAGQESGRNARKNRKGRDIGYALATGSCEGTNSVEACTVTAPDAITAFAVPNPNVSSQSTSDFSGLEAQRVAPPNRSPSLLRVNSVLLCQPFRPSTRATLTDHSKKSTQIFGAIAVCRSVDNQKCKSLAGRIVIHREGELGRFLHRCCTVEPRQAKSLKKKPKIALTQD
jgi:hypothetical protein